MATQDEINLVAKAINYFGGQRTAQFIADNVTAQMWNGLITKIETQRQTLVGKTYDDRIALLQEEKADAIAGIEKTP